MPVQRAIFLRDRLITLDDDEPSPPPYDPAAHDEAIWETFRMLEDYRSRGLMTKEEVVESLKRVVLND